MDEAVTNYINSHPQHPETVHVDASALGLNIQNDAEGRLVTIMHPHPLPQLCRQISATEQVGDGPWTEELDGKLAALVAQLAQHSRITHHQSTHHTKVSTVRDVESTVILDTPLRHYSSQPLEQPESRSVVEVLPPLPSLQDMKRCPSDWFHGKTKGTLKETQLLDDEGVLELNPGSSPAQHKQNKKSLPHKKRISRKLKRNTVVSSPQEDNIVEISCADEVQHEEILPDNFVSSVHPVHHITQEVRPVLICQICGDFYGEEQLKFYQHLKQHYEPHATIIIENPVSDQMATSCIVDNVAPIPDSIVELTLENSLPKTSIYQPIDKNYSLYTTTSDKSMVFNKVQYTMASDKDSAVVDEKDMYETLEKIELYSCTRCNKSFRRQKNCEQHIKEVHCKQMEEMNEFSEPEDLMAGIHVSVDDNGEQYEQTLLPHLTVDSGHIHQEHHKHWYSRSHSSSSSNGGGGCTGDGYCPLCPRADSHHNLKEEIIQRIFDAEVSRCESTELLNGELTGATLPEVLSADNQRDIRSHSGDIRGHDEDDRGHDGDLKDHDGDGRRHNRDGRGHDRDERGHDGDLRGHEGGLRGHNGDERGHEEGVPLPQVMESEDSQENQVCDSEKAYNIIEIVDGRKKSKIYSCNQCPRLFKHRNSVLYHKISHDGYKAHVCIECGKAFYTSSALKIHMRVHNNIRPYKCDDCGREFRQWGDLKYHVASLHTEEKNFKCEFCGKEFARKYSLNLHRRIHTGEKNYKCELCNKSFRASSYRLTHMRTHTGYKPHSCPICNKAFRVSADVRRHLLTHERARLRQEEQEKQAKENQEAQNLAPAPKTEIKIELLEQPTALDIEKLKAVKKIATASTTRPPLILKGANPKKPRTEKPKRAPIKRGAPNVVITNNKDDVTLKNLHDIDFNSKKSRGPSFDVPFPKQSESLSSNEQASENRQFAVLKPIPRTDRIEIEKVFISPPNTDGKMTVFTQVEKNRESSGQSGTQIDINDLRQNIEIRENRGDIPTENESGFIERLTAMYNITTV